MAWHAEAWRHVRRRPLMLAFGAAAILLFLTILAARESNDLFWFHVLPWPLLMFPPAFLASRDDESGMRGVLRAHQVGRKTYFAGLVVALLVFATALFLLLGVATFSVFGIAGLTTVIGELLVECALLLYILAVGLCIGLWSRSAAAATTTSSIIASGWWLAYFVGEDISRLFEGPRIEPVGHAIRFLSPLTFADAALDPTSGYQLRSSAGATIAVLLAGAAISLLAYFSFRMDREPVPLRVPLIVVSILPLALVAAAVAVGSASVRGDIVDGIQIKPGGIDGPEGIFSDPEEGREGVVNLNLEGPPGRTFTMRVHDVTGVGISLRALSTAPMEMRLDGGPKGNIAVFRIPVFVEEYIWTGRWIVVEVSGDLDGSPFTVRLPHYSKDQVKPFSAAIGYSLVPAALWGAFALVRKRVV